MLKPGVDMRSASRAAESSAVSKLIPEEGGEEEEAAMGEEAEATPRLESCDLPAPEGWPKVSEGRDLSCYYRQSVLKVVHVKVARLGWAEVHHHATCWRAVQEGVARTQCMGLMENLDHRCDKRPEGTTVL